MSQSSTSSSTLKPEHDDKKIDQKGVEKKEDIKMDSSCEGTLMGSSTDEGMFEVPECL